MKHTLSTIFTRFFKDVLIIGTGSLLLFGIVQFFSLSILKNKGYIDFDSSFFIQLLSLQMIPSLIAYILLVSFIFYLYRRTKKILSVLRENEIMIEREQAVIQTLQKVTGIMGEFISTQNSNIKDWIEKKYAKGEQVPLKVEESSMNIGRAMDTLSKMSFLTPYLDKTSVRNIEDYTQYLQLHLNSIASKRRLVAN